MFPDKRPGRIALFTKLASVQHTLIGAVSSTVRCRRRPYPRVATLPTTGAKPQATRNGSKHVKIDKDAKGMGMPWEDAYGYAQAVKVGDTIYVSGQLSHDADGNVVGAPPLDAQGRILDHSNMQIQMKQTYENAAKLLAKFGATLDNVVEEVLYVTDMDAAFAVAGTVRKQAYGSEKPEVASTILVTPRLALPTQLIEIKFVARV